MSIFEKLTNSIKTAMKEHDNVKRDCLRTVVSDIKNASINSGKDLTDDVCLKIIQKSVKTHLDSISLFKAADRLDLADKEEKELKILSEYLPLMYSKEQIKEILEDLIKDNSIELTKKNMGNIMKALNSRKDTQLIDKRIASTLLSGLLT